MTSNENLDNEDAILEEARRIYIDRESPPEQLREILWKMIRLVKRKRTIEAFQKAGPDARPTFLHGKERDE